MGVGCAHVISLEQLLWEQVGGYVDEQLKLHFGDLVLSLQAAEEVLASEPLSENLAQIFDVGQLERAVRFHASSY